MGDQKIRLESGNLMEQTDSRSDPNWGRDREKNKKGQNGKKKRQNFLG